MASTITILGSIEWAQAFGGYKALTVGVNNEPSISNANIILQTLLNPPFVWNWNRGTVSFLTTAAVQDYKQAVAAFGFIEKASYAQGASVTNTSLTTNVATYTAVNSFVAGNLVTVVGATNNAVFNVIAQPIVSANGTTFTVAITHANISGASEASAIASNVSIGAVSEISNIAMVLGSGAEQGTPNFIAPQLDDNAGNITFRLLPIPDQSYYVTVTFQNSAALISSPANTWAPLPDKYSSIYQWGFLSLCLSYFGDAKWEAANRKFVTMLLGVAEGLTEEQKNTFQTAWLNSISEVSATNFKVQQGVQSRGN